MTDGSQNPTVTLSFLSDTSDMLSTTHQNYQTLGKHSGMLSVDHSDSKEFPHILFSHYNRGVLNETMISWQEYTDEREG